MLVQLDGAMRPSPFGSRSTSPTVRSTAPQRLPHVLDSCRTHPAHSARHHLITIVLSAPPGRSTNTDRASPSRAVRARRAGAVPPSAKQHTNHPLEQHRTATATPRRCADRHDTPRAARCRAATHAHRRAALLAASPRRGKPRFHHREPRSGPGSSPLPVPSRLSVDGRPLRLPQLTSSHFTGRRPGTRPSTGHSAHRLDHPSGHRRRVVLVRRTTPDALSAPALGPCSIDLAPVC